MMSKSVVEKYWHLLFLTVAVLISLYFRIINPWKSVFLPGWVQLGGNDPWYYLRLIESTVVNFPRRIWFDAFTNYPYGAYTHFGPFLVYLGAILSKLAGAGDFESIKRVVAFIPAIGGTLLVFPVYVFTKEVFNRRAGVLSALIVVVIPGQLMLRSVLGFNDHHIWEVFWATAFFAMYVLTLNRWRGRSAKENVRNWRTIIYPILTGVSLGLYLDTWAPGFIAGLMLTSAVVLILIFNPLIDTDIDNILVSGSVAFFVGALIYAPFSGHAPGWSTARYSLFQFLVLIILSILHSVFYIIALMMKRGYFSRFGLKNELVFPLSIIAISVIGIGFVSFTSPDFLNLLGRVVGVVTPKGGALTVAEVQPMFRNVRGEFTLVNAYFNFSITFFFAIIGLVYLLFRILKERKDLFIIAWVWSFELLIAVAGQNRFAYYFAVICAILSAFILDSLLEKSGFYDAIRAIVKGIKNNSWREFEKVGYGKFVAGIIILLILFYPTATAGYSYSKYGGGGPSYGWREALLWMKGNTPDPGLDYYAIYPYPDRPGEPYPYYPPTAYGVMSWWDYGHWITTIAHRIPNANPFQQGIGGAQRGGKPGAAPFFTAQNEEIADKIADTLGVRYVVSDVEMMSPSGFLGIGKFDAMAVWAKGSIQIPEYYTQVYTRQGRVTIPSDRYFNTMEAKLHLLDGSGLKKYRMVFESRNVTGAYASVEKSLKQVYQIVYKTKIPVTATGFVKVFEYVKGAKITGRAPSNATSVVLTLKVKTNQGRSFTYHQISKVENGMFEFTVPYSQDSKYPVAPAGPYELTAGGKSIKVNVTEDDVINGNTVRVDFE